MHETVFSGLRCNNRDHFLKLFTELCYKHLEPVMTALFRIETNRLKYVHCVAQDQKEHQLIKRIAENLQKYTVDTLPQTLSTTQAIRNQKLCFKKTAKTGEKIKELPETPEIKELIKCNALLLSYGVKSCGAIPLLENGKPIGVLLLFSRNEEFFTPEVQNLLQLLINEIDFILTTMENQKLNKALLYALDHGFDFVAIMDKDFRFIYTNKPLLQTF